MGVCKPGYTSIHSLFEGDLSQSIVERLSKDGNQLCRLSFPLAPGHQAKIDEIKIGRIKNVRSTIRMTRERIWWLYAHQEGKVSMPRDQDTVVLLAMIETITPRSTRHVQYVCVMSIVSDKIVGTLRGESDNILARFEHESSAAGTGQVILSHGPKPINLLKATVAYQQSLFPSPSKALSSPDCSSELYAGKLTYCTWNSLQDPVPTTATSIFKTLSYFPLMPNNLLIDDGWQTTTNRQMSAYGAQSFFLGDYKSLGDVVTHAKKRGVDRVGVWHAVLGYWGGVYRESETFKHYRFIKLKKNWGATYDIIHPDHVQEFFDTWYTQLQEWGVDFVKCDDMAEIEDMDSAIDDKGNSFSLYAVRTAYVIAIKRAVDKYFNGRIIWCMAHSPRHLLGPHALSTTSEIKPLRSSNDYYPQIPASHAYHVYTNIITSQFLSCFTIADFDMFQTHSFIGSSSAAAQQGPFHASLRALGNGPVTVTDVPGHCVSEIYMRLAGRGRDGKTIALNADTPIQVTDDRCFDDVAQTGDGRGVRGYAKSKWGVIMGIWNVRGNGGWVKDTVSMEDVVSVLDAKEVVCWSHIRQEGFILHKDPARKVVLKELEFDVFSLVEMTDEIVCLGLVDKYNTLAAIHSRRGNTWAFRCLGEAVWTIPRHGRVIIKVEGSAVAFVRWTTDGITFVKASLTDYKDSQRTSKKYWTVEVVVDTRAD